MAFFFIKLGQIDAWNKDEVIYNLFPTDTTFCPSHIVLLSTDPMIPAVFPNKEPIVLTARSRQWRSRQWRRRQCCMEYVYKQYFDTRYLVFYNTSPPRMFLSLDLLWEYRIQHGANGPLYVTSSYSTWIFCRGVSGFATDCPCGIWCRGLTICLLHVGPPFGNRILNNSWAVGLT